MLSGQRPSRLGEGFPGVHVHSEAFLSVSFPRDRLSRLLSAGCEAGASQVSVHIFTESSYLHSSTPLPLSAAPSSLAPLFQALQRVNFQLSARDREEQLLASGAGQGIWNLLLLQTYGQSLFQPQLCPHLQRYLVSSVPAPCPHFLLSSPLCRQ